MKNNIFENDIIILRKPRMSDATLLMKLTKNKDVMLYYGMQPYQELEEAKKEIKWFLDLFNKNCGRWVIADKKTDEFIGDIGFFNYKINHNRVEIGFKLSKEFWKKNIMSECINVLLNYGFTDLKYNRIEAFVEGKNIGCK